MKKCFSFSLVFVLVAVTTLYAANGDLIVNGKVGIGTSNPAAKLDICDQGACVKWVRTLGNYGLDQYTYLGTQSATDTCNSDNESPYSCAASESRTCIDRYNEPYGCYSECCDESGNDNWVCNNDYKNQSVRCYQEYGLVSTVTYTWQ